MKRFSLIVEYECGKCVYPTDQVDLIGALQEFKNEQLAVFGGATGDKSFAVPDIISAELVKTYYRK